MKMKLFSILSALLLCTVSLSTFAQFESSKEVFSSPKLKTTIPTHKVVAIMPFSATVTYKRPPKNYDENAHKAEEKALTTDLQSSMYTFLLRKQNEYVVTFQDVDHTNTLLKQAGVYDKLDEIRQDSICKILKVDAVIKSKYAYEKT